MNSVSFTYAYFSDWFIYLHSEDRGSSPL